MDHELTTRLTRDLGVTTEAIGLYESFFYKKIKPKIKKKYLSHLVTTIEDMVNEKRIKETFKVIKESRGNIDRLQSLYNSRNLRLYSINLIPMVMKKKATTRYHDFGALIFYDPFFDDITVRNFIAHELGHIVNRELLGPDDEKAANLFAFIAMEDKNKFYSEECKRFITTNDLEILNDIISDCR